MLNNIILSGRLGREPRHFNAGESNERANFSIAVDEGRGDSRKTNWMDVVVFGRAASTIVENVVVGQELHVKGRLTAAPEKAKDASGQYDRVVWSIIADSFDGVTFGRTPRGSAEGNGAPAQAQPAGVAAGGGSEEEPPF